MINSARAKRALAHLAEVDPALAVLSLWCRHRDGEGDTETRGDSIIYGPSFIHFGLAEQVGLVAHHVLHVALRHSDRQAGLAERLGEKFDATLFGLAADGIINETLLIAGHAVPRPAVVLTDLLAQIGKPATSAIAALGEWDSDRLAMYLHGDPQRAEKAREYGKQQAFAQDLSSGDPEDTGEDRSAADWRNHVLRAIEAGRKAGAGIGRLGAILADLSPSMTPWEVELRGLLARALCNTSLVSYRRPSSRWVAMLAQAQTADAPEPAFEPGRARDAMQPRIVIGLDTSSSVDAMTMALFYAETKGVSRRMGAEAHLLAFDEAVHEVRRLDGVGWRSLQPMDLRTGGGTDFAPVMEAATRLQPSVLVMLTDLDADFGPPPGFPVLWAVPGRGMAEVPFGRVLMIGE